MALESVMIAAAANLLSSAFGTVTPNWQREGDFDLFLEDKDGRRIAVEVLSSPPSDSKIEQLSNRLAASEGDVDEFVLVTTDPPDESSRELLLEQLGSTGLYRNWLGINELPDLLGLESPPGCILPRTGVNRGRTQPISR